MKELKRVGGVLRRQLLYFDTAASEEERLGKLLNTLLLGTVISVSVALPLWLLIDRVFPESDLAIAYLWRATLLLYLGAGVVYLINYYWSVWVATPLFLMLLTGLIVITDTPQNLIEGRSLFLFTMPVLMASVLLRPWASFVMAAIVTLLFSILNVQIGRIPGVATIVGFFIFALIAWIAARSVEEALAEVRAINEDLDRRVRSRTAELSQALGQVRAEALQNRAILRSIADGVIVFDGAGRARIVNPAIGTLLSLSPGKIAGRKFGDLMEGRVDPAQREQLVALLARPQTVTTPIMLRWGERMLSITLAPLSTEPGRRHGTVAVFRDFTREAEIDRLKSDFISITSHELRAPLGSIQGYLDLLLQGEQEEWTDRQRHFLQITHATTGRLLALVEDLLDLSRIESGGLELDRQLTSLREVVVAAAINMQPLFAEKGLYLRTKIATEMPPVWGDPVRLFQILINLLSNAHKYTEEGGAAVRVRVKEAKVQVDVVDTGIGISRKNQEMLFERFFRARDPVVRRQSGTGLGLNISRSLVELHGGELWLESKPGVGTKVSFTLPIGETDAAPAG